MPNRRSRSLARRAASPLRHLPAGAGTGLLGSGGAAARTPIDAALELARDTGATALEPLVHFEFELATVT
jgi:hypothetical protein